MAESLETCTVELVEGVDITKLPLAPLEGFVLSRVDRRVAVAEVAALTGLPSAQLTETLLKLAGLGALRIFDANGSPRRVKPSEAVRSDKPPTRARVSSSRHRAARGSRRPMMAESGISNAPKPPPVPQRERGERPSGRASGAPETERRRASSQGPRVEGTVRGDRRGEQPPAEPGVAGASPASAAPGPSATSGGGSASATEGVRESSSGAAPAYDPKLLDEEVDLPRERRKQVLELEYRLKACNHYEALGVEPTATRKEIRTAYFALSKAFHPDTMFRRQLGSYKARMELVFKGITEAYEVLSRKQSRADYDAYLEATRATQTSERQLRKSVELEGLVFDEASGEVVAAEQMAAPAEVEAPERSRPSDRGREVARQAVAARIGRTIAAVRTSQNPPVEAGPRNASQPPVSRDQRLRSLAHSLRHQGRVGGNVDAHVEKAREAEAEGDIAGAQEHLRQAISLAPGREDLQEEHTRLSARLADQLASDYAQQAELEERTGKWSAAALSWAKVFAGRPEDALAARRAAAAIMRAGGDLRRAHHFAREAVLRAPNDVECRITLGQIMLQVGLTKGAKRELQAALGLDPRNEMVKNLLAELQG